MIDKCAKFEEVCERKSGRSNDRNRTGLWGGHPVRKMEGPAVRLPIQKVADAVMIMLTDHGNGLPDQRMEWMGDDHVEAWIPGIMTLLPRLVDEPGRRWPPCCKRPK
ncbi:MAG: hypothetical protein EOQ30_18040 [Mesorhizobium sp.]|nr:hypothetical protein [Mesorhizobium sp.]RWA81682.1 MAG: hypothetical protein EOQ30_18040 [Mesorhizobium sp.]TIS46289.1 MAG: hypothetical protein E5W96_28425 [Mesorhizobium sp.]